MHPTFQVVNPVLHTGFLRRVSRKELEFLDFGTIFTTQTCSREVANGPVEMSWVFPLPSGYDSQFAMENPHF